MYVPLAHKDCYSVLPKLLRPKSRGTITLRSKDPMMKPYIRPNYLTEDIDVKTLIEGEKFVTISNHKIFFL